MQRSLLVVWFVTTSIMGWCQQKTLEDVLCTAKSFVESFETTSASSHLKKNSYHLTVSHMAKRGDDVMYYVINKTDGGWLIVSGDSVTDIEILAYSDEGSFDYDNAPLGAKEMLRQYEEEIVFAISASKMNVTRKAVASQPKRADKHDVSALVQSKWNQNSPYWNMCPTDNSGTCYTGCVATAMAQVMRFWQWPTKGTDSKTYTDTNGCGKALTTNFGAHTYDWTNMALETSGYNNNTQKNAVAQLMYDCGVSVEMQYTSSGSGAYLYYATDALTRYFGYDFDATYIEKDYYTSDDWAELMYDEVANGRPVLYVGYSEDYSGHAFILDGYQQSTDKYHFNFGWSGSADGFWALDNISGYKWNSYGNQAIIGIKPADDGRVLTAPYTSQSYLIKHIPSGLYVNMRTLGTGNDAGDVTLQAEGTPLFFTDMNNGWCLINEYSDCAGNYLSYSGYHTKPNTNACLWLLYKGENDGYYLYHKEENSVGYLASDANAVGSVVYCNKSSDKKHEFVLEPYDGELTYQYVVNVRCIETIKGGVKYAGVDIHDNESFEHTGTLTTDDFEIINVAGYNASATISGNVLTVVYDRNGYEINFDKSQTYIRQDRYIKGLTLATQNGDATTIEVPYTSADNTPCYQFLTLDDETKLFSVYVGDTLTPTFVWKGNWMHGYVYVDVDDDGSFDGDLVSQSTGEGEEKCLHRQSTLGSFVAPSRCGKYRMRFKIDWDNTNPAGYAGDDGNPVTGNNGIIKNGGSITDVMLVVMETPVTELQTGHAYKIKHQSSGLYVNMENLTHSTGGYSRDNVSLQTEGTTLYLSKATDDTYYINVNADNTGDYLYAYLWDAVPASSQGAWKIESISDGVFSISQVFATYKGYFGSDQTAVGSALYCNKGTAQGFVLENAETVIMGDVNGDGFVNITDVVELNRHILQGTTNELDKSVADMNGDGEINISDIVNMIILILK